MRSSLSTAGRRAGVLAATALVALTTACGPADFRFGATAASGSTDATGGQFDGVARGEQAPVPVPSPGTPSPTPPADTPPADTPPADTSAPATSAPTTPVPTTPVPSTPVPTTPAPTTPAPAPTAAPTTGAPTAGAPTAGSRATGGAEYGTRRSAGRAAEPVAEDPGGSSPVAAAAAPSTAPAGSGQQQAAAAPGTPAVAATTGSGGTFTDRPRTSFTAGNGQTGQYLLYAAGIDATRPVGLVVYVDGTGEYGVDNPTSSYALGGSAGLVATSRARNMITLAVESPNQSCECWHTGNTSAYADFLAQLIETQLASYPIGEVWLSGFSSGAQEITRFLVPRHPELLRLGGGWVVFGGGGPPADGGAAVTAARMAGVRGHWYTGTADTAVPLTASWGAQAGERFYAGRGVVTSHEWPQGVGHGLDGKLGRTVGQLIDAS